MKIIISHNIYNTVEPLKHTIEIEKSIFPKAEIYVSSNGVKNIDIKNVNFRFHIKNLGWALGAFNTMIDSIKFATESTEGDILLFSHDDVEICNSNKVLYLINKIYSGEYDVVVRSHEGDYYMEGHPYYMIESVLFNFKKAKEIFKSIPIIFNLPISYTKRTGPNGTPCIEMKFAELIKDLKILELPFKENVREETDMGFINIWSVPGNGGKERY